MGIYFFVFVCCCCCAAAAAAAFAAFAAIATYMLQPNTVDSNLAGFLVVAHLVESGSRRDDQCLSPPVPL